MTEEEEEKEILTFERYINVNGETVYYIEGVTPEIFLGLEQLLYSNKRLSCKLAAKKVAFILDVTTPDQLIDPKAITSFPIIHFEANRDYVMNRLSQWPIEHLPEDKRKYMNKVLIEIILPTLESLVQKDEKQLEAKVTAYLNYLTCILPFSKPLEAALYVLLMLYRTSEEDHLKL